MKSKLGIDRCRLCNWPLNRPIGEPEELISPVFRFIEERFGPEVNEKFKKRTLKKIKEFCHDESCYLCRYDFFEFLRLELRQILVEEGMKPELEEFKKKFVEPYDFLALGDKELGGIVC